MRAIAVVVTTNISSSSQSGKEFLDLALSAGYEIDYVFIASVRKVNPATYLGEGHLSFLSEVIKKIKPEKVLINKDLSARFTRNIQKITQQQLLDRTELILRVFDLHAISFSGKLQVELAQLRYMSTKLVRGWTHLERQRGGIGLRSGPGETQIEVDRRILRERITSAKRKIAKLRKTRSLNRAARTSHQHFTIAIVGYTNAGKSTLFNRLTNADAVVKDQLFVTLDPLSRRICQKSLGSNHVIVTDTVGFIDKLPGPLMEAFASTLEEVVYADLLLHVMDYSDPELTYKRKTVEQMLHTLGAEKIPRWTIYNKMDLCSDPVFATNDKSIYSISAQENLGVSAIMDAIHTISKKGSSHLS
ncbi:MAG: GTPase HflX [Pseudomonadota bacterium]|nr:GTPase HflX [Pseudomonadota bacterium]MEC8978361.1 GTPase HflX [Pseudomonadota bacterium]